MTTLTPPTPPTADAPRSPEPGGKPPRHPAAIPVTVILSVLGAALIVGTVVAGVATTVASSSASVTETLSAPTDGVTEIDVEVAAVNLDVVFADVDEARLDLVDTPGGWRLERDGDELQVSSPSGSWFSFGWSPFNGDGRATLTLPRSLEGVDASFTVGAGELVADGRFGELDVDVSAGGLTVSGDARSLSATVGAGSADLRLAGVSEAEFEVAAGDMDAHLTGRAPREVSIEVSAGSLDLTLPDGAYDVRSDVSAGEVDNRLPSGSGTRIPVEVRVSAGDVTLRPAN
ncbi:hypothetical protein AB0N73_10295 [Microbacterium sp. NPDC089189]|uniref:hypothetical protein n=1 Tax=Microbacterium sp. NPDC089189 TaxID=3154972 RepID=UPI0034353AD5